MRIRGRYRAKRWFRPWMFRAIAYPAFFAINVARLHRNAVRDVDGAMFEWSFRDAGPKR